MEELNLTEKPEKELKIMYSRTTLNGSPDHQDDYHSAEDNSIKTEDDGDVNGSRNDDHDYDNNKPRKVHTKFNNPPEKKPHDNIIETTTIYNNNKINNPSVSIIEIIDNTPKSTEESVHLIGSDDEEDHKMKIRLLINFGKNRINHQQGASVSGASSSTLSLSSTSTAAFASSLTSTPASASASTSAAASVSSLSCDQAQQQQNKSQNQIRTPEKRLINVYSDINEFEQNLPQTVKILETPYGSKVYLIGTAHFSEESQDDVSYVIRNVKPDVVMVELCTSRIHILKHDEKFLLEEAKNFNITKIRNIIRTNGVINGVFFILLLRMSAQLAKDIGMAPGGEFRRAFDEVQNLSRCTLHLGDRPINITLQRALRALSLWQTVKLVWRLTSTERINVEEVEECKQKDLLEKLLQEMAGEFPAFSDVFVKERDLYLCHSLQVASLPLIFNDGSQRPVNVVGVIGIGHTAGIMKNWLKVESEQIREILKIPPSSLSTRLFKYTIKIGFCSLITYGIIKYLRPKLR